MADIFWAINFQCFAWIYHPFDVIALLIEEHACSEQKIYKKSLAKENIVSVFTDQLNAWARLPA